MPMFDIEDSKNVRLKQNKTGDNKFVRARGVENLEAVENEAGTSDFIEAPRRFAWFRDNIAVAVGGGLLVILILGVIHFLFPSVTIHLPP